jgi:hypothetical protein
MLMYSHGYSSARSEAQPGANRLASYGYIIVAPDFPLTNLSFNASTLPALNASIGAPGADPSHDGVGCGAVAGMLSMTGADFTRRSGPRTTSFHRVNPHNPHVREINTSTGSSIRWRIRTRRSAAQRRSSRHTSPTHPSPGRTAAVTYLPKCLESLR